MSEHATDAALVLTPVAIGTTLAVRGAVVATLWEWYAVPLGAPPISVAIAVGLCLILRAALPHHDTPTDPEYSTAITVIRNTVGACTLLLITLAIGALVGVLQ